MTSITALHHAVKLGEEATVISLLEGGVDINSQDVRKTTPLGVAAREGNLTLVKLLVSRGADVQARDYLEATPLFLAAEAGHLDIVKYLLEEGGSEVDEKNVNRGTPFWCACNRGDIAMAEYLLQKGANPHAEVVWGGIPLHTAVRFAQKHIVALLIKEGADVRKRCDTGETPFFDACQYGHVEIAQMLAEVDASTKRKGAGKSNGGGHHQVAGGKGRGRGGGGGGEKNGHAVVGRGVSEKKGRSWTDEEVAALPLYDVPTRRGVSPLHVAVREKKEEVVSYLAQLGANTDVKDIDGRTPLQYARDRGEEGLAMLMTFRLNT
mmetsp:Transcript_31348/g.82126  ORF Transcript_31348/g.82126 Transcript_31348/m.82126 type:complete len:322 (+) Transcript_31348:356-1321(+)|eukprot:CAMPEP_0113895280 /NCGR_PEP_ID=MMETSP0780_2-20120614/17260_1 /TAXON_ID=652834 /ORGANISM="Palpitomonas bilix" /LENGTH=321 /DNA_ID=CAMNT_0000886063 /DNA_START=310 /DNA_END=1275 /DNA_ORIENTATION=+ /assembly_acc=CAM_ASM_000599